MKDLIFTVNLLILQMKKMLSLFLLMAKKRPLTKEIYFIYHYLNYIIMKNLDLTIDQEDLKTLYIACKLPMTFSVFCEKNEAAYKEYHARNTNEPERYGRPKTFSQWVNAQIISLT